MGLKQLIKQCQNNNTQAQGELYQLFSGKLFAVCLKYSPNTAEAEDNLQDAFVTIFKKIKQYKHKGSFEGWMKRITVNTVMQRYRKTGVLNIVDKEVEAVEEVSVPRDKTLSLDCLLELVQGLPDRYRLVFNLYVLDGYSHSDIAEMLDISTGTSKSNLARARSILKEKIEEKHKRVNSQTI